MREIETGNLRFVTCALTLGIVVSGCSGKDSVEKTTAKPPFTRTAPVTDVVGGVSIADNYRWLEGDNSDPKSPGKITPEIT